MIERFELCEHWGLWDDCYDCGTEAGQKSQEPDKLIYLCSSSAPGTNQDDATESATHVR